MEDLTDYFEKNAHKYELTLKDVKDTWDSIYSKVSKNPSMIGKSENKRVKRAKLMMENYFRNLEVKRVEEDKPMIYTVLSSTTKRGKSGTQYYSFSLEDEAENVITATGFNPLMIRAKYKIDIVEKGYYHNVKRALLVEEAPISLAPEHLRKLHDMERKVDSFESKVNQVLEQQKEMLTKMQMFEMFFKAMGEKK